MGLTTSRPLIEDSDVEDDFADHDTIDNEQEEESCCRYIVRVISGVFGYSDTVSPTRNLRRKRRRDDIEKSFDDEDKENHNVTDEVTHCDKVPKLDTEENTNISVNSEPVLVEIENETGNQLSTNTNAIVDANEDNVIAESLVEIENKIDTGNQQDTNTQLQYLNFPFLTPDNVQYLSQSQVMFVMRGLPGSGKSTIVHQIHKLYPSAIVCSADQYFIDQHGQYQFDVSLLKEAHQYSQNKAREACEAETNVVIVDNTGVKRWELVTYFKIATQNNYAVVLVEPRTPWKFNVRELVKKNSHQVDGFIIKKRAKEWEQVIPLYYGWFLHVVDTKILLEKLRSFLSLCLDIEVRSVCEVNEI